MNKLDDTQQLVDRCLLQDRRAQHELYSRYCRAIYNICLRMIGTREEAEDLLQETFVDVFGKLNGYRQEATLGAWIKRIAINNCISKLRKHRIQTTELTSAEFIDEEQDLALSIDEHTLDKVRKAIMTLPDGYRVVFSLYLLEGYDHQEIAQILGISEGASKSQYSRAKQRLQTIMKSKT